MFEPLQMPWVGIGEKDMLMGMPLSRKLRRRLRFGPGMVGPVSDYSEKDQIEQTTKLNDR
jgi:hypothetical protein